MAKRKTRVTKKQINAQRKANRPKINKKKTSPGPWTNKDTELEVKVRLRPTNGMIGEIYGIYTSETIRMCERGWYPIKFNITSKSIKRDVLEWSIDDYMAACEKSLNTKENKAKYGTVVIMEVRVDKSVHDEREQRFISCLAKTNKKSIKGFAAVRKKVYKIL